MTTEWLVGNLWHYSVQVLALVVFAGAGLFVLGVRVPRYRLAVLQTALAGCLLLPLQALVGPQRRPAVAAPVLATPALAETTAPARPTARADWTSIAAGLYGAGLAIRAAWLGLGIVRLRRRGRGAVPEPVIAQIRELQERLGTSARVEWCDGIAQPHTYGLAPPVVLLPSVLCDEPAHVRLAVACHELLHVRRRDWAYVVLEEITRVLLWFHPAIWWLIAEIHVAREQVVDREVVDVTGDRQHYIGVLMSFANAGPLQTDAASVSFFGRHELVRRVSALLTEVRMSRGRLVLTTVALCAAVGVSTRATSRWFPIDAPPGHRPGGPQQSVEVEPGPLERQAVTLAPGARGPRRLTSSGADVPMERWPLLKGVTVTLRVVLDASGSVAETRPLRYQPDLTPGDDAAAVQSQATALADFLQDMVRDWRYEPPAEAPLAMTFAFAYHAGTSAWSVGSSASQAEAALAAMRARVEARDRDGKPLTGSAMAFPEGYASMSRAADGSVRIGGAVRPPEKQVHVNPIYPADARAAGVQGVVILETKIAEDGSVEDVRVLRSIPLLDQAAIDAVWQWRYSPTLINGSPTKVTMTLTVNFVLP